MTITWPITVALLGVTIALLTFIHKMSKKEITLEDVKRNKEVEEKIDNSKFKIRDNKKDIEALNSKIQSMDERIKYLLDKVIDLIKTN